MAMGDGDGLKLLAGKAGVSPLIFFFSLYCNVLIELFIEEKDQNDLAFAILVRLGDSNACLDLSTKIQRSPEPTLQGTTL